MRLTAENFFTHFFLLHHDHKDLDEKDHQKALVYSIALGIISLGTVHATCALIEWCIQPKKDTNLEDSIEVVDQVGKLTFSPQTQHNIHYQTLQ